MHVSQIFLSDNEEKLPQFLQETTNSVKSKFIDSEHKIYTNKTLRSFIKKNYPTDVLWAYDTLNPYSYKSDLGRFCLLYKLGGWYFDIGTRCIKSFHVSNNVDMICFRDEQRHSLTSWAVNGAVIYSKPENIILQKSIEAIISNCREKWYGRTPLCPTGPALFGEQIAKENRGKNLIIGDLIRPMIPFTRKNFPFFKRIIRAKYILPNGKALALVKPASGGNLKTLGVKGSNNYNNFWNTGNVYKDISFYTKEK